MRNRIDIQRLKELFDRGLNYESIAKELSVTKTSVGRAYRRNFGTLDDRGKSRRQSIEISEIQKQILFGSLLGDAHISKHSKTYRGCIIHSVK